MEDAVTRTHAQQLVAAALYVGSRIVGSFLGRLLAHPNRLVLRAEGLPHTPENAARLQAVAARAVRRALGEPPAGVVAQPDHRGGWRVHVLFADSRPPLEGHELTDLQIAWERLRQREFGRPQRAASPSAEIAARQQDATRAVAAMRDAQAQLLSSPTPASRERFQAAVNHTQVTHDALRAALQRADPVRSDRRLYHDSLVFRVKLNNHEALDFVQGDRAVRDLFARAAALPDPSELRVTTRPTRDRDTWLAHVAFNFRNTREPRTQHLNPASLRERILSDATSVPALAVHAGAALLRVSSAAVQAVRQPARVAAEPARSLAPPGPLSGQLGREHTRT